jgi:D-lyxose ketol-isomerase
MKLNDMQKIRKQTLRYLRKARIAVTPLEAENIEVADMGLNDIEHFGLQIITYENNDRYCAKELVLFPRQICPEHRHPPIDAGNVGKQETFRCRWGEVYLYVEGVPAKKPKGKVPKQKRPYFTVWHEIVLKPGDQYTLPANSLSEFSSSNIDEKDVFTDPAIQRMPVVEG